MPGTPVRDALKDVGEKLYAIENASATGPGRWAVTRVYSDLNEARREMALLPAFKNQREVIEQGLPTLDDLVIREYTVKQPLPTRQGMTGPQEEYFKDAAGQSVKTGQIYPGGAQQVELLIDGQRFDPTTKDLLWKSYLNPTAQYRIGDKSMTALPVVRTTP